MASTSQSNSRTSASKNMVLVTLTISILALAIGAFALSSMYFLSRPAPQTRTFLVSIDFYNATSGTTSYISGRITPSSLTAYQGDTVVFNVTNRDPRPITATAGRHGFTVEGSSIATMVDPGQFTSQVFATVPTGTYKVYCQMHAAHLSSQLVVLSR